MPLLECATSDNLTIVSWNINGIRATKTPLKSMLDSFTADIICLQETKTTRDQINESLANVDGYNSYFSFSRKRSGYSGVVTYCRNGATPMAAEEGLSGHPLSRREWSDDVVGHYGDHDLKPEVLQDLDSEGRAMLTRHLVRLQTGEEVALTVINVYCPRSDPDKPERLEFKLKFYKLLQIRAEAILNSGCHVIIVGDINTSHKPVDHCDPSIDEEFSSTPSRKFLDEFLVDESRSSEGKDCGRFVDTFRHFHPNETNAFTCWCTVTGARHTNYGTRLDYIFANLELVRRSIVAESTILPDIVGSDHCPVRALLRCRPLVATKCPSLCSKYWPEFAGKQMKLSSFLNKHAEEDGNKTTTPEVTSDDSETTKRGPISPTGIPPKRRASHKSLTKQKDIVTFFKRRQSSETVTQIETSQDMAEDSIVESLVLISDCKKDQKPNLATQSVSAWKALFKGPGPAPLCSGHKESCVRRTVKKPGPNFRRDFYVCARPEGHASNPKSRCNFFAWASKPK